MLYRWRLILKPDAVTYVLVALKHHPLQRGVTQSCPGFSPNLEISLALGRRSHYRWVKNENYIALRLRFGVIEVIEVIEVLAVSKQESDIEGIF
jgi:hypothetical protein